MSNVFIYAKIFSIFQLGHTEATLTAIALPANKVFGTLINSAVLGDITCKGNENDIHNCFYGYKWIEKSICRISDVAVVCLSNTKEGMYIHKSILVHVAFIIYHLMDGEDLLEGYLLYNSNRGGNLIPPSIFKGYIKHIYFATIITYMAYSMLLLICLWGGGL